MKYGVTFGGNSSNSGKIFTLQKKIIELWLVHNPEPRIAVCLNRFSTCAMPLHALINGLRYQ